MQDQRLPPLRVQYVIPTYGALATVPSDQIFGNKMVHTKVHPTFPRTYVCCVICVRAAIEVSNFRGDVVAGRIRKANITELAAGRGSRAAGYNLRISYLSRRVIAGL